MRSIRKKLYREHTFRFFFYLETMLLEAGLDKTYKVYIHYFMRPYAEEIGWENYLAALQLYTVQTVEQTSVERKIMNRLQENS